MKLILARVARKSDAFSMETFEARTKIRRHSTHHSWKISDEKRLILLDRVADVISKNHFTQKNLVNLGLI